MKNLVIIGTVFPEPQSTAAGFRMLQLIELFQSKNYQITFLSSASINENSYNLAKINVNQQNIVLNDISFDETIKKLNPNIVIFDRFTTEEQFGWRVSETCPDAIKILDTEDLHFLRKARELCFKENRTLEFKDYLTDIFKREIASILRCDVSLIISEFEINILTETFKINSEILYYLPFLSENHSKSKTSFEDRKHFVSIGNFLHEPNWQTVLNLKKIWKNIKKQLPKAELHIFGAYSSEKVLQLHNEKEGFIIKGRVNSVEETFENYRVLLAPIPFGAGLKGKLFESMKFGIPNVTTEIGAEGMTYKNLWNGFIEDDENNFVKKSVLLYSNQEIWEKSQENGYEILENKFKKELFENHFFSKIEKISENLESHRNQNFLGKILQHHSLQSTKYLSKWIEEKNKKSI